ncbi:MAG: hypothetical protein JWM68_5881 [Verrucomicrobiales bacterium]|nr:hypothetical protein [Verrucomicrobiales bacterium]
MRILYCSVIFLALHFGAKAERINQEGRILGPLLSVTNSVLFNTAAADAVVSTMQIYPANSAWNEDISRAPLLTNSAAMMSQITNDLATNRQTLRLFPEMNYALVPTNQPLVPIAFVTYPGDSDPAPYPIPTNMPVETWPSDSPTTNLYDWQRTVVDDDRHSIVVMPSSNITWETWQALLTDSGWQASNGAKFDLNGNKLRTPGLTSGDAAGLPMFPALVRYDECERGMVEHAMRIVVKRSRMQYIYPATHYASTNPATVINIPAMGQRVRLKATFTPPGNWTKEEKAVVGGLKKYGAMVADNGGFFSISITPDDRWPANCFSHINSLAITNFEVIQTTGPTNGTRTPNPPVAFAGADFNASVGVSVPLQGFVATFTNLPVTNVWKLYSGPSNMVFAATNQTNSSVTFNAPGTYTLMLSGNDGVHPIAYDAVIATVGSAPVITAISRVGTNVSITWSGGVAPFVLERATSLASTNWIPIQTNNLPPLTVPIAGTEKYFRLRAQ